MVPYYGWSIGNSVAVLGPTFGGGNYPQLISPKNSEKKIRLMGLEQLTSTGNIGSHPPCTG